ncbi:PAS domain S-box protein [Flexibacter flexilis]|nr:PAS domain S-box protein [Flexibacter flexilis]
MTATKLQQTCTATGAAMRSFIITKNVSHKQKRKNIYEKEVMELLEQLNDLVKKERSADRIELFNTLSEQIVQLGQAQELLITKAETTESLQELADEMQAKTSPLDNNIYRTLSSLIASENAAIKKENSEIAHISSLQYWFGFAMLILSLPLAFGTVWVLIGNILTPIQTMRRYIEALSRGELPSKMQTSDDEIGQAISATNVLIDNLTHAAEFSVKIGKGEFDKEFQPVGETDVLGNALTEMQTRLQAVAEEDRKRNWATQGLAQFAEILRSSDNVETLSDNILLHLVRYTSANQGAIFVINDTDEQSVFLEQTACYAYNKKKHSQKQIQIGQGLVGQAYLEAETIYMKTVPQNYVHITSGLGEATPAVLLIVPLKLNDRVEGVLELAAFQEFLPYQIAFVEKLAESIAASFTSIKINNTTRRLLTESQYQAEQMRAQEEEMRQNMEELSATQEELDRQLHDSNEAKLKFMAVLNGAINGIVAIDEYGKIELVNPAMLDMFGYTAAEMEGKNISMIMPKNIAVNHDDFLAHYRRTGEKNILAQGREVTAQRKDGSTFPVYLAVNETFIEGKRWYTGIIRDITKDKEAEQEIKNLLTETQLNAEELQANEEELRQNMEELRATQEDLNQRYKESALLGAELNARVNALNKAAILSESDLYGNITYVNDKLLEITGYTREELIGKPHSVLRHPDTPRAVFEQMWKTIKSGHVFQGTYQNRKKDGSAYWVEATIAPVLDINGNPEKYVGIRFDITHMMEAENEIKELLSHSQMQTEELKVNEEELRQNMEELRAIQEDLNARYKESALLGAELNARVNALNKAAILSESDLYGNITYVNDKLLEITGYTRDELIGKPHSILRHPETPRAVFEQMWKTIKAGHVFQGTYQNRRKDGSAYWVEATIAPVLDMKGNPEKYVGIRFDITHMMEAETEIKELLAHSQMQTEELKVNEEELRQNMEELRTIQEDLNERYLQAQKLSAELNARVQVLDKAAIVSESDLFGTITYANKKFTEISGYSNEELIGKPHNLVRHPDMPKAAFETMWKTIKAGNIFQGMVKNRRKDGSAYWVEATIAPVLGPDGQPEKYIGVRFDITQIKQQEEEVEKLLTISKEKTESLIISEEELRQNMEELKAIEEDLKEKYNHAQKLGAELNARVAVLDKVAIISESDLYGNILSANDKFCEISGYSREELIGKPHNMVRHPDTPKEIFKELWDTIKAGKVFQGKIKNRRKDGSAYWVEATIAPVLDEDGKPLKYIGIRFDVTAEMEKQKS